MTRRDQLRHLPEEEGQQQRADVRAVDVGVGHQHDAAVAQFGEVEPALLRLAAADPGAERGDQRADLGRAQHAVEPRALDVQDLALQRQDRLELAVAALLGRAARAVALDDEDLGARRVAFLAVGELARQARDVEHALASRELAGATRRLAGGGGVEHLLHDGLRLARMRLEPVRDRVGDGSLHHRLHLGTDELVLGLTGEFRVRHLHRQHRGEAFAHVVAVERDVLLRALLDVAGDDAGQRLTEAREMGAAVTLRNVVREAQHGLVVAVVPRHRELDADAAIAGLAVGGDRRRDDRRARPVEILDEGGEAALVAELLARGLGVPLVAQHDPEAGVQEGELAHAALEDREIEVNPREGAARRLEGHLGAARLLGRADHAERIDRVAVGEADLVLLAVPPDPDQHPFRQRVHDRRADAVQAARDLVGVLIELAAGVQARQHHLGRRHALLVVEIGRDAAPVVAHGHRTVAVQHELAHRRETRLRLVDRVVDDLERHVMQAGTVIGVADIHAGPLAHGVEAAEYRNGGGIVGVALDLVGLGRLGVVGHAGRTLLDQGRAARRHRGPGRTSREAAPNGATHII